MSSFDDEFGLFSETVVDETERQVSPRKDVPRKDVPRKELPRKEVTTRSEPAPRPARPARP
ncbi:MAG: hypothetical protein WAL67_07345, partial [Candidatus Cybelea sp.]